MKKLLLIFSLFSIALSSAQTPTERYIFDEFIQSRSYQLPGALITKSLPKNTSTAKVEIFKDNVIANVRSTQFGVNTPFRNGADQRTRSALYNGKVTTLRFPAGSGSNLYFFDGKVPAQTNNYLDQKGVLQSITGTSGIDPTNLTPTNFVSFKNDVNGQAIVVVNYFYARYGITTAGTRAARVKQAADYAAAFVRKLNVTLGGKIKYWEIGNECYGAWEAGFKMEDSSIGTVTGTEYGEDFNVFVAAMKAVDPTIKCGVVLYEGTSNWNSLVLPQVKNTADFVSVHEYFNTVKEAADFNAILGATPEISNIRTSIQSDIVKYTGNSGDYYPIALTEFNSRGAYNCSMINGVFISQILGEIVKNDYGLAALWVSEWAWDDVTKDCKGFLATSDPDQADYTARQAYIPFYYYAKCFGDKMVKSTSTNSSIVSYASTFSSGEVGLVLINKSATTQEVNLSFNQAGITSVPHLLHWYEFYANTIDLANTQYKKFYVNDSTSTTNGGGPANLDRVGAYLSRYAEDNTLSMRPYSVIYLVVPNDEPQGELPLVYSDAFEQANGYKSTFSVSKQTSWSTLSTRNNPSPNVSTSLIWKDVASATTVATDKTYNVSTYAEERSAGIGTQCLKFTINNLAFGAAHDKYVRWRGLDGRLNFDAGETLAGKYDVTLWARIDGAPRPVFKSNSGKDIEVTNQWTKYTIDKYAINNTSTGLAIEFVPQSDNSDLVVYIDDVNVRLKDPNSTFLLYRTVENGMSIMRDGSTVTVSVPSKIESIQVFNSNGLLLLTTDSGDGVLDFTRIGKGAYVVRCKTNSDVYTSKFIY